MTLFSVRYVLGKPVKHLSAHESLRVLITLSAPVSEQDGTESDSSQDCAFMCSSNGHSSNLGVFMHFKVYCGNKIDVTKKTCFLLLRVSHQHFDSDENGKQTRRAIKQDQRTT